MTSNGWVEIHLSQLGRIVTGKTPSTKVAEYFGSDLPFVTPSDMHNQKTITTTERYLTKCGLDSVKNCLLPAGSVMVSCIGSDMGKIVIAGNDCVTNQQINAIIVEPRYSNEYVYYNLKNRRQELKRLAAGGSAQPILNKGHFGQLKIAMPPPDEQRNIVNTLKAFDDKIDLNRQMNGTLENIAKAIFKSWFIDFDPVQAKSEGRQPAGMSAEIADLLPSEFVESTQGLTPKGWCIFDLEKSFEVNPPYPLRKEQEATYVDMAALPTSGHRPSSWTKREFTSGSRFTNGDTLVARITPCLENGKTAFIDFLSTGEIGWGSTEFIVLKPKPPIPKYFAYLLARTSGFRTFAIQTMTGTSGRQRVQVDRLKNYSVILPMDDKILQTFESILDPLVEQISVNDEQNKILAEIRDLLLPQLLSGKLRIKEADKQLEKVL